MFFLCYVVMIDRKYNRTADTGRFELIHRGTCVPIPIYVGIDLRVEGKNNENISCMIIIKNKFRENL